MVLPSCDGPVARDFDSKCSRVCSGASRRGISLAWMRLAGFQRDSFEGWWNEGAWSTPQPPSHLEFSHILAPLNFPLDVTAKRGSMGSGGKAAPAERERERAIYSRANGVTKLASRARCRLPAGRPTHCLAAVLAAACLVPLHATMPRRNPPTEPRPGRASSRAGGGSVVGPRGVQLCLRGGRSASDEEEAGAGVGAHQPAAFRGEVKLCGQHSLAHIVENAHGPLRVLCGGGGHSWPDAAAVSSPFRVDIAAEQPNAILAGQWFLMKSSRGCFSGVTLVHRSVMDKRNLELREDMLIIEGRGTAGEVWDFQNCSMWTEWGGVLTCMGSAQVTMADCVLSGAGAGNMRAEHGVAAYDDARVGLRRCLLQVCVWVCMCVCVCVRVDMSTCTCPLCVPVLFTHARVHMCSSPAVYLRVGVCRHPCGILLLTQAFAMFPCTHQHIRVLTLHLVPLQLGSRAGAHFYDASQAVLSHCTVSALSARIPAQATTRTQHPPIVFRPQRTRRRTHPHPCRTPSDCALIPLALSHGPCKGVGCWV